jgi:hypothetical protein
MADTKAKFIITAVDDTKAAFNSIKTGLGSVTSVAATLGVTLSAGAFVAWTKGMIDAADELNDLSQRVGVGIKELAGYKLAAEQSGASLETVAKGIKGLAVYMTEHSKNMKDAGIQAKTTDEMMVKLADIFAKMPDGLEKTALSVKLFGKAGSDLIPMLNLGGNGLQEAKDKAEAYGKKMAELAPLADQFNDKLAELKISSSALGLSFAQDVLAVLGPLADQLANSKNKAGETAESFHFLGESLKTILVFGSEVGFVFKAIGTEIGGIAAQIAALGKGNFSGAGAIHEAMMADAATRRAEQDKFTASIMASTYSTAQAKPGTVPSASTPSAADAASKAKILLGQQQESAKKVADTYKQLTQSIAEYQAQLDAQEAKQGKLTKADELAIQAKLKLTAAQVAQLKPALEKIAADERELELRKAINKRAEDNLAAAEKETASIRDQVIAQNDHNDTIGLTTEQLGALEIARIDEQIAAKQTLLSIFSENDGRSAQVLEIKAQVDALNELKSAKLEGATRQTIAENIKRNTEEWKRFTDDIESSLTDALMRGFEGGKDGGKNFVDSLKNTLKTAALKIVVQAIVNPVMGGIQGALSSGGFYGSNQSGVGTLSLLSSLSNGNASFYSGFSSFAGSSIGQSLGLANTASFVGPVAPGGTAGLGLTSFGSGLQSALPYFPAIASLAQGNIAQAGLSAVGAYFGGPIGGMIGSTIGGLFGGGGGAKVEGDAKFSLAGNTSNYAGDTSLFPTTQGNSQIRDFLTVPLNNLQETIKQLGGTLNSTIQFGFDADPKGSAQSRVRSVIDGTTLANGTDYGRTESELQAGMTKELERLLIAAFDKADFDPATKGMISVLRSAGVAIQDISGTLVPLRAAFTSLGMPVSSLTKELVDAFGGIGNLESGLSSFYDNFYSDAEKYNSALGNISSTLKSLGVSVIPSTREEYRRLVEAQDLNTDSGRAMYASLIAVSGAFANITQASNSASTSLSNTAASIADAAQASFDNAQSIANSSLSDLANSIDAQKTSLQNEYDTALKNYNNRLDSVNNSISKLQVLATSLKSTLDGMRISGSDTLYRINAQAQIREVIASVKSGGSLPLNGQLDSALATLSKPSEQLFATFEDYAKDFYATANDISMLGDLTGQQLTADEQMQKLLRSQIYTLDSGFNAQINALNDIYNSAKLQLDALNGINTNILSVNAALGNFNSSILSLSTAKSAVEAINSDPIKNAVQAAYAAIGRSGNIDQGGYDFWTQNLSNGNISMDQFQNTFLNSAANSTNSNYQSAIDQAKLLLARGDDLPGFAIGTNYVPNDMTARIHQGERIIPAADNQQLINLLQSSPSSNSLIAEIQALRAEVRALKSSNESIAKSTAKFANQFETASEGGRAMLTEAYV